MLSKEEIEEILEQNEDIITYKADKDFRGLTSSEKTLLENNNKIKKYITQLEQENIVLKNGLDRNKKSCFYEDGHTEKCLGYSFLNNDEPCEYCKSCEALSIKGED